MAVFFLAPVQAETKPDYGDAFIASSIGEPRTLIPILASDSASSEICGMVFNGLVKYNENLELVGDLAESWEVEDGGLVIIFHLRKGVRWHDGEPFTAEDVKFTYEALISPDVPTPYSGDFKKVESVEIPDPHTVKVIYKEPFSPGLSSWGMPVMPAHILKGQDLLNTEFARDPVGTGPYKFIKWKTGQRIDLVSNKDYFEHRPYIDRYIYRIIPDPDTTFLELQTLNVDAMGLSPLQFSRLTDTKRFKKDFQKFSYPSFGYTYMGYNLENEMFKDKRARRAINYAVNKEEIIDGVLLGHGKVSTGPFPYDSWAYNRDVEPAPYNREKAVALLKEAGWTDSDNDGWINKDGRRFEFTILTNQGNIMRMNTAQIIQGRLKDVGIKVNIRVLEWSVFLNEFVNKKRFDAILLGWILSRDPDCYDIWHSSKVKPGEFNVLGYSNTEVDGLLDEGRRTFDKEERKRIYNRIHELIYDDQPCLFIYVPDSLIAVNRRFKGIKPSPIGISYNFIDWWVPRGERKYKY